MFTDSGLWKQGWNKYREGHIQSSPSRILQSQNLMQNQVNSAYCVEARIFVFFPQFFPKKRGSFCLLSFQTVRFQNA